MAYAIKLAPSCEIAYRKLKPVVLQSEVARHLDWLAEDPFARTREGVFPYRDEKGGRVYVPDDYLRVDGQVYNLEVKLFCNTSTNMIYIRMLKVQNLADL